MERAGITILIGLVVLISCTLGCTEKKIEEPGVMESPGEGSFQLLISDAPADIEDFGSLVVTFSHARVFKAGENGSEAGFEILELNSSKVDLTQLIGEKALSILNTTMEAGNYSKIELHAEDVQGVLVSGDMADVTIPSDKLQITISFEVKANETTTFVFDINVVKKGQGNEYNLLPVISESGVVGEDLGEDEVEVI